MRLLANAFEMKRPSQAIAAVRAVSLGGRAFAPDHAQLGGVGGVVRSPCAACEMCNTFVHLGAVVVVAVVAPTVTWHDT